MENKEKMKRAISDELCRIIEADLRNDPNCPAAIKAGLNAVKALRALDEASSDMVRYLNELVRVDDVGHVKELEQYVKLVTTGIRQYLAAINYRPKAGGAT